MNVVNEVIQGVCDILDVKEVGINTDCIKFGFIFDFRYSVNINYILDRHDLYDWNVRYIVDEIVDNIEYEFLSKTIRKRRIRYGN